jgi:tRNA A37 threonylcarbamoyladenosine synthetase subunit TsaC/SUA5/YrdC
MELKKYFKDKVDFYLSGGTIKGNPSILLEMNKSGSVKVLRGTIKK